MATQQEIQQSVTIHKPAQCDPSYVLYNSRLLESANLIDLDGTLVHSWTYPQGESWHYAEILPNGHLAAIVKENEGRSPGMLIELDWTGNLVRRFDVAAHHDFQYLENGNVIVLCREYVDNPAIYLPTETDPAPTAESTSLASLKSSASGSALCHHARASAPSRNTHHAARHACAASHSASESRLHTRASPAVHLLDSTAHCSLASHETPTLSDCRAYLMLQTD